MNNLYFNDIYNDFFKVEKNNITDEEKDQNVILENIDELYLDNESKNLFKQILSYMEKYHNNEENNYINFNMIIEGNNKETVNALANIISSNIDKNKYLDSNKIYNLSLYNLNNKIDINEIYNNNSIIIINDLSSISMQEDNKRKMFFYDLKNNLNNRSITILNGDRETINNFLLYDSELKNKYFNFHLLEIIPNIQDIYNDILRKIDNQKLEIDLLDYITNTYKDINNYPDYRDNLINYISFNKALPPIKVEKTMEEIFSELNSLVGLNDIKKILKDLVNLISFKDKSNLDIKNINLNMLFLGNPGTGKTTVARILAGILYNLGYIKENKLVEVTSKDLVAEYVGQTSIKTYSVLEKAFNGVLFIDEAYSLSSKNNSYNDEAIATLIKTMEDNRDKLVIIFAGYTKEMQDFINSNSGIASRIGYTLNFKDYTEDELIEIFKGMITKAGFKITPEALDKARGYINEFKNKPNFGNARMVRNMYEKTVLEHASNTKDYKRKDKLITITDKDITVENMI